MLSVNYISKIHLNTKMFLIVHIRVHKNTTDVTDFLWTSLPCTDLETFGEWGNETVI